MFKSEVSTQHPRSMLRRVWGAMLCASLTLHCGGPNVYQVEHNPAVVADNVTSIVAASLRPEHSTLNASFVRFGGQQFMAFRLDGPQNGRRQQQLAFVAIDDAHRPLGKHRILHTPTRKDDISSAEDPRLFEHEGQLYVVYNARPCFAEGDTEAAMAMRRLFLARIDIDRSGEIPTGAIAWARQLDVQPSDGPDAIRLRRWEKNWSPFSQGGDMYLIYRANPPQVLKLPAAQLGAIEMQASGARAAVASAADGPLMLSAIAPPAHAGLPEPAGNWRGGTPAIFDPELGEYVTFYHTRTHADYGTGFGARLYYMLGVYTFAPTPPFAIRRYLPEPLQVRERAQLPAGWTRIVFPSGIIDNGNNYMVSFGRDDQAIGVAGINKQKLFAALQRTGFANITREPAPVTNANDIVFGGGQQAISEDEDVLDGAVETFDPQR